MEEIKHKRLYLDWLWKLHDFGVIERQDLDREAGHIYEFPKCCIENYISIVLSGKTEVGKHMDAVYGEDSMEEIAKNLYVRCPKCRKSSQTGW